ncbi:MAG: hypothetical protein ACFFDO_02610 [Candidatus Thorarchaeota archaeon]
MTIDDLTALIKKKGFRDTFHILTSSKDYKCEKHAFYNELNQFSYYNSFFRIKEELLKRELIEIEINDSKKHIKLTEKGIEVYHKLMEINDIINEN